MVRSILHCDLNNFYASVACHDNPELRGKPVAVGGSVEERHGIILAKSEIAKKYGVATGDAIWQAKLKCPSLIVVPPDFKRYTYFSKEARKIYSCYTDNIEPFGIDECWLDVTGSRRLFGDGTHIANTIRNEIRTKLGLTISVGVSFNKIFAKLGSDLKKPDATSVIPFDNFREIVWPLEANRLLGVGKSTEKRLRSLAVYTIGDLAAISPDILKSRLGKAGEQLWRYANGMENSAVLKENFRYKPQSIGRSVTCPSDITCNTDAYRIFLRLSEEIARELRKEELETHAIQVYIRKSNLEVHEFIEQLEECIQTSSALAEAGMRIIRKNFSFNEPLRSIGIRAVKLKPYKPELQLSFFEDRMKLIKQDMLERSIDAIRERFGKESVVRAALLNDFTAFRDQSPSTLGRTHLSSGK